jgi:putative Mg2+ transporter-C (MgtC) family protein
VSSAVHADGPAGILRLSKGTTEEVPVPQVLVELTTTTMLLRLLLAGVIGGLIGYERRLHGKAIGVAGMMLVAVGSAAYMLLARHLASSDPASISRALQGLMQGIGFLGGAVIFKAGVDVRGIKTAAAIWITGAVGLAIGIGLWLLGVVVGLTTVAILYLADHIAGTHGLE